MWAGALARGLDFNLAMHANVPKRAPARWPTSRSRSLESLDETLRFADRRFHVGHETRDVRFESAVRRVERRERAGIQVVFQEQHLVAKRREHWVHAICRAAHHAHQVIVATARGIEFAFAFAAKRRVGVLR